MAMYLQLFVDSLDEIRIEHADPLIDLVTIPFQINGKDEVPDIYCHFIDLGECNGVNMFCFVESFLGHESSAAKLCDELNAQYKGMEFSVASDSNLLVCCNALVNETNCSDVCLTMLMQFTMTIENCYDRILKAKNEM